MDVTISQARAQLGRLCTRAQDPRAMIILTRNSKPVAALVSISEVERIWDLGDNDRVGWRHPLSGIRGLWSRGKGIPGMEPGPDSAYVTAREAALKIRDIQMTRAEERRVLRRGGMEPVEGGELGQRPRPSWWRWWLRA